MGARRPLPPGALPLTVSGLCLPPGLSGTLALTVSGFGSDDSCPPDRRPEGSHPRGGAGQKALVPFGVPSPVGPSQPVLAVHQDAQVPLLPDVTSNSPDGCA